MQTVISTARRAMFLWGSTAGVAVGVIAKSITDANKKFQSMRDLSYDLGITMEELYAKSGRTFDPAAQKAGKELAGTMAVVKDEASKAWEWFGNLNTKIANFVITVNTLKGFMTSGFSGWGQGKVQDTMNPQDAEKNRQELASRSEEAFKIQADLKSKMEALQGDTTSVQRRELDKQYSNYVETYGTEGEVTQMFRDFRAMQENEFFLASIGMVNSHKLMIQSTKDSVKAMQSAFQGLFLDVWDRKLKTAKEYFFSFLRDIYSAWTQTMSSMMATAIAGGAKSLWSSMFSGAISGATSGAMGQMGDMGAGVQGGAGSAIGTTSGYGVRHFAKGGIVGDRGPEMIMAGEQGTEQIIPAGGMRGSGPSGKGDTYHYWDVKAIDSASFASALAGQSGVITEVVNKAIQKNSSLRKTIREYA